MRFWLTRTGEVSLREQLKRQILLGILSEDLPAGARLPSVRALARRYRVHANTVSPAYRDLRENGWLELRRGSGLYVRSPGEAGQAHQIDAFLEKMLREAASNGWSPETVLERAFGN